MIELPPPDAADHEAIGCASARSTLVFAKRTPHAAEKLIVTIDALPRNGAVERYDVEFDLTRYPTSSFGTSAPVFSLYNLGLQSWKHQVKIMDVTYLDPVSGQPAAAPKQPVMWVKNFPQNDPGDWTDQPPAMAATGAIANPDNATQNQTPHLPVEENIWFLCSPESKRFRLEVHAVGRKFVGRRQPEPSPAPLAASESSHGDVPPMIPPGGSDDNDDA